MWEDGGGNPASYPIGVKTSLPLAFHIQLVVPAVNDNGDLIAFPPH